VTITPKSQTIAGVLYDCAYPRLCNRGRRCLLAAQYHPVELQNQLALPIFKDTLINLVLFIPFS
jgi:hypothetical protein